MGGLENARYTAFQSFRKLVTGWLIGCHPPPLPASFNSIFSGLSHSLRIGHLLGSVSIGHPRVSKGYLMVLL